MKNTIIAMAIVIVAISIYIIPKKVTFEKPPVIQKVMSSGLDHHIVLRPDGSLWTWGSNKYGQLGDVSSTGSYTPVCVTIPNGMKRVLSVAAASTSSLVLCEDGSLWEWGRWKFEEHKDTRLIPTRVEMPDGMEDVISIAGGGHFLALCADGSVWGWGDNQNEQLGDPSIPGFKKPVHLEMLELVGKGAEIAASTYTSLILTREGELWEWGRGNKYMRENRFSPNNLRKINFVESTAPVSKFCSGETHSLAVLQDGTAWYWDMHSPHTILNTDVTQNVIRGKRIMLFNPKFKIHDCASGLNHSYFMSEGKLVLSYQLLEERSMYATYVDITGYENMFILAPENDLDSIIASGEIGLARYKDGRIESWGNFGRSEEAIGCYLAYNGVPVRVKMPEGMKEVTDIDINSKRSIALCKDGNIWTWGKISSETNVGAPVPLGMNNSFGEIAGLSIDGGSSVAFYRNGSFWTWGDPNIKVHERIIIPEQIPQTENYNAGVPKNYLLDLYGAKIEGIFSGEGGFFAISSEGRIWVHQEYYSRETYGVNFSGQESWLVQTYLPDEMGMLKKFAFGRNYALAMNQNNELWAWGYNKYGQLGTEKYESLVVPEKVSFPDDITKITSFATGISHSLALCEDGSLWVWGRKDMGQLAIEGGKVIYMPRKLNLKTEVGKLVKVFAGGDSSFGLSEDGTLWAWGENSNMQLGDGTNINRFEPVKVKLPEDMPQIVKVKTCSTHTLAICEDGSVWSWGTDKHGQLGRGVFEDSSELHDVEFK